jgi:hypothetical protein
VLTVAITRREILFIAKCCVEDSDLTPVADHLTPIKPFARNPIPSWHPFARDPTKNQPLSCSEVLTP